MDRFSYARARDLEDALGRIRNGAKILAGGTEILNCLRLGAESAESVVDISGVSELSGFELDGDQLRIGALATLSDIERWPELQNGFPALVQACRLAASPQIRNRATFGGNLLQRTRCPYFRTEAKVLGRLPWACNKRAPGSGCSAAKSGLNGKAALFGGTPACSCTNPSDPIVALAACDATVHLVGSEGPREILLTDFLLTQAEVAMDRDPAIEELLTQARIDAATGQATMVNRLRTGELISHFSLQLDGAAAHSAYVKVRERQSYEYANVAAAACVRVVDDRIAVARIALGSVAQKPWRLRHGEKALVGAQLDIKLLLDAFAPDFEDATPLEGQAYRVTLAHRAAARAVLQAGGGLNG